MKKYVLILLIHTWIYSYPSNFVNSLRWIHRNYGDYEESYDIITEHTPTQEMFCNTYNEGDYTKHCFGASDANLFHNYDQIIDFHGDYGVWQEITFLASDIKKIPNGIFDIPKIDHIARNLIILNLHNVNLEQIAVGALYHLTNIERLILNQNKIIYIQQGAFNGLSRIRSLDLSENKLTGILDKRNFTGIGVALEYLDLSWNDISFIRKNCFVDFYNLKSFNVSHNSLVILPSMLFYNNQKLSLLNLGYNNITEIGNSTFPSHCIDTLDLRYNNLSSIYSSSFSKEESDLILINDFNLAHNFIDDITDLLEVVKINNFSISDNEIREINNGYFCERLNLNNLGLTKLTNISMCNTGTVLLASQNRLQQIPKWTEMLLVDTIELQYNNITEIPLGRFHDCQQLTKLRLDQNAITKLDTGVFSGLINLKSLNISFNRLTVIDSHVMYGLKNLQELYLGGNMLTTLPTQDMLEWLKNLKMLGLNHNYWDCMKLVQILRDMSAKNVELVHHGEVDYHVTNLGGTRCFYKRNFTEGTRNMSDDLIQNSRKLSSNIFEGDLYTKEQSTTTELYINNKTNKTVEINLSTSSETPFTVSKEVSGTKEISSTEKENIVSINDDTLVSNISVSTEPEIITNKNYTNTESILVSYINNISTMISTTTIVPLMTKIVHEKINHEKLLQSSFEANVEINNKNDEKLKAIQSGIYELKNVFIIIVVLLSCIIFMKIYKFYREKVGNSKVLPSVSRQSFANEIEM